MPGEVGRRPLLPLEGEAIVFDSDRTGNYEIYALRLDGAEVYQLTLDPRFDSWAPRLSPDRRQVLFYRTPKGTQGEDFSKTALWMMAADGSDLREARPKGTDGWVVQGHAEWSPDGRQLVMLGGNPLSPQVFITDPEGKNPRQVTDRGGVNLDPSWSPDGKTIAFVGCASFICFEKDWEIFTIPAAGGKATQLTSNSIRDNDPYYSPDGTQIVWEAETEPNAFAWRVGAWNIFVMAADGSNQRQVTNDRNINTVPQWSRDGRRLYLHRFEPGKRDRWGIYTIRPDGTDLREITTNLLGNNTYASP